jgi:hypothetical protein
MYPLEELEERVEKYMTGTMARWPRYETVTTPGHGHEEEIYETERDIRDLDFDDPEYASKHAALLAERARLRGLPHVPARTERRKTSGTIGQHWATLETDADKRAFLLELGMTIRVRRGAVIPGPGRVREKDSALFEVFGAGADYDQFLGGKLHDQADDEA